MINYVQLIVGDVNKTELDLSQEFQISLQYSIADVKDISKRNASFSKTIILPGTKTNNTVLGNLYDPTTDFTYFNPNVKTPCSLFVNSELVIDGFLQLRNIKKLNNADGDGNLIYWEVVIFNDAVDLLTELGEKTMNQINLLELTHDYTADNIIYSWTQSWQHGFVYPMYGFEQQPSTYRVSDFYPAYYSKYLLEAMLQDAGFGWTGSLRTNAQFEREVIPFVGSGSQSIGPETINEKNFRVGITQSWTFGYTYSGFPTGVNFGQVHLTNNSFEPNVIPLLQGGGLGDIQYLLPEDNFQYPLTPVETLYDNGGEWDVLTSVWTTTRKRKWSPIWQLNYDFTLTNLSPNLNMWTRANDLNPISINGAQYPIPTAQDKSWNYPFIDFVHTLEYEAPINLFGTTVSVWFPWDSFTITRQIQTGGPGPTTSNVGGTVSRAGEWKPGASYSVNVRSLRNSNDLVLDPGIKVRMKIKARTSTNLPQNQFTFNLTNSGGVTFSHYQANQGRLSFTWRKADGSVAPFSSQNRLGVEFTPRVSPQNFLFNNGQPFAAQEGDQIYARDFLNSKLKQKDFLADLIKRYNLYIQPSPDNDRQLIIDTRKDFYDRDLQLDWTGKKDLLTEDKWDILSELQFKEALFTMTEDSDFHNEDYLAQTGDIYGQFKWIFGNEFVKGEQKIESPFSPTPLVKTPFGAITPALSTDDPKVNPRVLYWGGLKPTLGGGKWQLVQTSTNQTFTYSQYPYAGHFDDPITPSLDIHFGTPAYLYYNNITTLPYNTMFTTYWLDWINQIEDGRMLTAKFYLDEIDVKTIAQNFWAKIWIWNSWYWVNKIIDYQPLQGGLTTVELLKIRDGVQVSEEPKSTTSPVRNPLDIREPDPIGVIKIGMNNDTSAGGGIVIGDGNSTGGISLDDNDIIKINRNIVVGNSNNIKSYNGVVMGDGNTVNSPWGFVIGGQGANVTAPDIVVVANKEGREFNSPQKMYVGTGIEADTESKVGLFEPHRRGVNIAVDNQFLGQTDWKTIPEAKEVVISDKKISREENLDIWGSLVIEGNTSTQSFGNSTIWDRGQVQVDKTVNLSGVATVLGQMDIGTNIPLLSASPQGAVIHATFSQSIATASTPQIIQLNNLRWSRGVTLQSNRIYIQNPGTYKMTVTILVENDNGQPGDIRFWLEFNGSPYPLSGHYFTAPARKSTGVPSETIINFDFIGTSQNYNDYVELWWQGETTDLSLHYEPESGGIPAAAAVTVNLNRL